MIEKDTILAEIGKRIALSRRKCGLSQAKLSEILGKNDKYINLIECGRGRLSLSALIDVANVLDEPLSYFLDGGEETEDIGKRISRLSGRDRRMVISLLEHFERGD